MGAKKYKFRKVYIHCVNGQAIGSNIQSSTFWRLKNDAVSNFVQNGKHIKRVDKYQWEKRIDQDTVEGFYLVHESLYNEILEKYNQRTTTDEFTERLLELLENNRTWIQYGIDPKNLIGSSNDVVWVELDKLPKNYQTKYIYPNFNGFVESFFEVLSPLCEIDVTYHFNFIYQRKSHAKLFRIKK